ncbi:hypothetical protein OSTOST_03787 [Ostertagia ostertagi]
MIVLVLGVVVVDEDDDCSGSDGSSSSSGCSSSATCELYDLATAHALLARQQQLIQQANFPLITSAELVQQLAHHQQLQQLQHHIQGIVHHNLVGDMALVSHPATAAAVGAAPMYAGNVVKQEKKSQVPTPHQVLAMQQQQLPQSGISTRSSDKAREYHAIVHPGGCTLPFLHFSCVIVALYVVMETPGACRAVYFTYPHPRGPAESRFRCRPAGSSAVDFARFFGIPGCFLGFRLAPDQICFDGV